MSANLREHNSSVTVKTESGLTEFICASCGNKIVDRYFMKVAERSYHEDCVACTACSCPLSHSCFIKDLKLYCRADYERIFGAKCARCVEKINCSDLVMRVAGLIFHVECFACCMCGQALPRGAHYVLRQGQPICRRDYEHEFYLSSSQGHVHFRRANTGFPSPGNTKSVGDMKIVKRNGRHLYRLRKSF